MTQINQTHRQAIVLMSGGVNAVTLLHELAFKQAEIRDCMIFDFNQGNVNECDAARFFCAKLGIPHSSWAIQPEPVLERHVLFVEEEDEHLSYRGQLTERIKLIMLATAASRANALRVQEIYSGDTVAIRDDFDCALGHYFDGPDLAFRYPYEGMSKKDVFQRAHDVACYDDVVLKSASCDEGDYDTANSWGYGCGGCPGCVRRSVGWKAFIEK